MVGCSSPDGYTEPTSVFLRLLRSALAAGLGHVAGDDGGLPAEHRGALGWRRAEADAQSSEESAVWRPQGQRVGWTDGKDLFLDVDAALRAAQMMASDSERIAVTTTTLSKRLNERGYLLSTEGKRGKIQVRRMLDGVRRAVLHLDLRHLAEAAQSAHEPALDFDVADAGPKAWAEDGTAEPETGPPNGPTDAVEIDPSVDGPIGPEFPSILPTDEPRRVCFNCKGRRMWRRRGGTEVICGDCQTPGIPASDVEWLGVDDEIAASHRGDNGSLGADGGDRRA